MEGLITRLDCFDDDGKKIAIEYLNKCLTKFLQTIVREEKERLQRSDVDPNHIDQLCKNTMVNLGLISKDDPRKHTHNINSILNQLN